MKKTTTVRQLKRRLKKKRLRKRPEKNMEISTVCMKSNNNTHTNNGIY